MAMMVSYVILIVIYGLPLALWGLARTFNVDPQTVDMIQWSGVASPMIACLSVPMDLSNIRMIESTTITRQWLQVAGYFAVTILATCGLVGAMLLLFRNRWTLSWRG